jgi:ketosteroid isomerase-like protein
MSQENVELWRKWIKAFNSRDIEALIALCDPNIEFHSAFAAVGGATYRGHDALRSWHRDLREAWGEEIRVEPDAYFDLGEHTLTFSTYYARGLHSGAEVVMPATGVTRSRDGLVTYVKVYLDRTGALRDVGVSEDELEPIEP